MPTVALKSKQEKGTENERKRTKKEGLQYMFSLRTKHIQSMNTQISNREAAFQSQWKLINVFSLKAGNLANLCHGLLSDTNQVS